MALVLTRKTHQSVVVKVRGEKIRITLARIQPESCSARIRGIR